MNNTIVAAVVALVGLLAGVEITTV